MGKQDVGDSLGEERDAAGSSPVGAPGDWGWLGSYAAAVSLVLHGGIDSLLLAAVGVLVALVPARFAVLFLGTSSSIGRLLPGTLVLITCLLWFWVGTAFYVWLLGGDGDGEGRGAVGAWSARLPSLLRLVAMIFALGGVVTFGYWAAVGVLETLVPSPWVRVGLSTVLGLVLADVVLRLTLFAPHEVLLAHLRPADAFRRSVELTRSFGGGLGVFLVFHFVTGFVVVSTLAIFQPYRGGPEMIVPLCLSALVYTWAQAFWVCDRHARRVASPESPPGSGLASPLSPIEAMITMTIIAGLVSIPVPHSPGNRLDAEQLARMGGPRVEEPRHFWSGRNLMGALLPGVLTLQPPPSAVILAAFANTDR